MQADSAMPPLKAIKAALQRVTEALAAEVARPGSATPDWNELEWKLAMAAAAAHGVSPLLCRLSTWEAPAWRRFLEQQREHVRKRHERIAALLGRIDDDARAAGLAIVPLKGAALHALGLYAPGDRPMADIDLLVQPGDAEAATRLMLKLGYVHAFDHWRHRVFKPETAVATPVLGEHRDTPINVELHTHIRERLPVSASDITAQIYPWKLAPGLNPYPSIGALMSHLLLHAAGNVCGRGLRLIQLHDVALLAQRMTPRDWATVRCRETPRWALPPLRLVARYDPDAIPARELVRFERGCPALLRMAARRNTLTRVSCSELWNHPFTGIEWFQSIGEFGRYVRNRCVLPAEVVKERADMLRTQAWQQGRSWNTRSRLQRALALLTRHVPRMDTLYVVRMAMGQGSATPRECS